MKSRVLLRGYFAALLAAAAFHAAQAEESVVTKSQAVGTQPAAPAPAPTAEEQALAAIQEQGQQRVAQVLQSMQGMQPGPAMEALQAQIVQIKTDTYVRFLSAISGFARARGDEKAALEAEKIIEQVLHPQVPAEPSAPQPRDKSAVQGGGK
jgi:hypothetical protein